MSFVQHENPILTALGKQGVFRDAVGVVLFDLWLLASLGGLEVCIEIGLDSLPQRCQTDRTGRRALQKRTVLDASMITGLATPRYKSQNARRLFTAQLPVYGKTVKEPCLR